MSEKHTDRIERAARLRWVPIEKMRVSPVAQRRFNPARADYIATNFDLEQIGVPTVNERDAHFYVIDGQHRIEALKLIGYGDKQILCWCYVGLTEEDEADRFDRGTTATWTAAARRDPHRDHGRRRMGARRPRAAARMSEHGTYSRYTAGACRCDACRAAAAGYMRGWRAKNPHDAVFNARQGRAYQEAQAELRERHRDEFDALYTEALARNGAARRQLGA